MELFCNCPLLKYISSNTKCLLVWCDQPVITCLVRDPLLYMGNFKIFKNALEQLSQIALRLLVTSDEP